MSVLFFVGMELKTKISSSYIIWMQIKQCIPVVFILGESKEEKDQRWLLELSFQIESKLCSGTKQTIG